LKGHLDSSRFFAQLRRAVIACPRCSKVAKIPGPGWNPALQRWRCPHCSLILVLGVIAWQTGKSRTARPHDTVPSFSEGLDAWALDQELKGHMRFTRRGKGEMVNVALEEDD
jgi:hypothetical protein